VKLYRENGMEYIGTNHSGYVFYKSLDRTVFYLDQIAYPLITKLSYGETVLVEHIW
jgi:hypothetical protein